MSTNEKSDLSKYTTLYSEETAPELFKVGIKIPPFWPEEPEIWFAQVEAQFSISGISSDITKFNYVIGQLDHQFAREIKDVITNPPKSNQYEKLKTKLIRRVSDSQERKIRQLLVHEEFGNSKPSQFLRHLEGLAGPGIPHDFLRTIWIDRLPHNVQKPLMLQGHERAITQIKYNREGDLLFSAAKDAKPNVWWSLNGERLGTFNGHGGVVWCLDVDWQSVHLITGGGDSSCRLWDLETGKNIATIKTNSSVRTCNFSFSAYQAAYTTDKAMGHPCEVFIVDTRTIDDSISDQAPILKWEITDSKVTSMVWGTLDETIITGHEAGDLIQWDLRTGKKVHSIKEHTHQINDMQLSRDGTMFITASKDQTAKLFDTSSLELLKEYRTERPVNSAALSPILDHVVLGGGQDAMEVTTTSTRQGKFDARFFHLVFEEEFGRVKGHFGPINSLAFHPDGKSYASGGEDGYVRVQSFDQSYFDYTFDYNRE